MSLVDGTRLGPYEIGSPIGKGGMGEVYRARDTKLGREVAIKVLPEEFAKNDERLDGNDDDLLGFDGVEETKREATHYPSAEISRYDWTAFGKSKD